MKTTVKMWAVFNWEGIVLLDTLDSAEYNSQNRASAYRGYPWWELMKIGYTCRPVMVTIEEIKDESQGDH